jgi:hypothetical protein
MITDFQKAWLKELKDNKTSKKVDPHKYSVYMARIRERVDSEMENLLWCANNAPEILLDAEWELEELGSIRNRRLKILLQVIKAMYPEVDPQLIRMQREAGLMPYHALQERT